MEKARKRTMSTIGFMLIFAIIVLIFYYYLSNRTNPLNGSKDLTEVEKIVQEDLENQYPQTPREVVKFFGRIMKALYNHSTDEEINSLAIKIRELYDDEFLENNPEDAYLTNLKSDIAKWEEKNRRITNYRLVNDDLEEEKEINGVKYSVNYISYTIQENGKFTETWKVLLRQDDNERWKIVGWEFVSDGE